MRKAHAFSTAPRDVVERYARSPEPVAEG